MFVFILFPFKYLQESVPGRTPLCIKDLKNFCANKFIFPEKNLRQDWPKFVNLKFHKTRIPSSNFLKINVLVLKFMDS